MVNAFVLTSLGMIFTLLLETRVMGKKEKKKKIKWLRVISILPEQTFPLRDEFLGDAPGSTRSLPGR